MIYFLSVSDGMMHAFIYLFLKIYLDDLSLFLLGFQNLNTLFSSYGNYIRKKKCKKLIIIYCLNFGSASCINFSCEYIDLKKIENKKNWLWMRRIAKVFKFIIWFEEAQTIESFWFQWNKNFIVKGLKERRF